MDFEYFPAAVGAKIDVVDVNSTAGSQHAKPLEYVVVSVPGFEVHDIMASGHAPADPTESAIIAELPAGNYTMIVRGVDNTTGVALAEAYDLSPETGSILGNISTRAFVQTGDDVVIGGFMFLSKRGMTLICGRVLLGCVLNEFPR